MIDWEFVRDCVVASLAVAFGLVVATVMVTCAILGIRALLGSGELHNTWGDSAEFSQLATGQERFSEHATNADGLTVVVDHQTGAQYLLTATGACPLLDVDGSPLRVLEATDDGE